MISTNSELRAYKFLEKQGIKVDMHRKEKPGEPDLIDINGNRYEVKVTGKQGIVQFTASQIECFKNKDFLIIYENDRKTLCIITKYGIIKKDISESGSYFLSKKRLRRLKNVKLPM